MELKQDKPQKERLSEGLLIVPYGIETFSDTAFSYAAWTFNRTLWN